jgi:hypothetical protein
MRIEHARVCSTHVDDDPLTEVVVVWDGFEVLHPGELAVWGRPVLVLAAEFGQRPATHETRGADSCSPAQQMPRL